MAFRASMAKYDFVYSGSFRTIIQLTNKSALQYQNYRSRASSIQSSIIEEMFSQHDRQDASSAKTPTIPLSQRTLRAPVSALTSDEVHIIHILVMGLTGAGKSTFIKILTGDNSIKTGNGLRGGKFSTFYMLKLMTN